MAVMNRGRSFEEKRKFISEGLSICAQVRIEIYFSDNYCTYTMLTIGVDMMVGWVDLCAHERREQCLGNS